MLYHMPTAYDTVAYITCTLKHVDTQTCTHLLGQQYAAPRLPVAATATPDLAHTALVDRVLLVVYPGWLLWQLLAVWPPPVLPAGSCAASG